jgi:hypothetical protein
VLEDGWRHEVRSVVEALERSGQAGARAAVFRFAIDAFGARARLAEALASGSALLTGLPRPEQGLVIHRGAYERAGGFRALPAMAEADLMRRIGPRGLVRLRSRALAGAAEPGRAGPRAALGAGLLMLRVPPSIVARLYA